MLQKGGDYLKELKLKLDSGERESTSCKQTIAVLRSQLETLHNSLPNGDGVIVNRTSASRPESALIKKLFEKHVTDVTTKYNWKYWTYSQLMTPFLESFNRTVRTGNIEELKRTSFAWIDQHYNFPQSRATLTSSLTQIAIKTSILTEPDKLPEESIEASMETDSSRESSSDNDTVKFNKHCKGNIS